MVSAEIARDLKLTRRTGRRDHSGAQRLGDLDGSQAHAAGRGVHQHNVAGLDARPLDQGPVARWRRYEQARGICQRPALWHGQQVMLPRAHTRRVGALACAEYAAPDGETWALLGARRLCRDRHYNASELGASYPGKGWGWLLVNFARFLEDSVEARRVTKGCLLTWLVLISPLDL